MGRYGGQPTSEATASYVISMADFTRAGLKVGLFGKVFAFADGFQVQIVLDTRELDDAYVHLSHRTRDDRDDREVSDRVRLTRTRPQFGGHRWWFVCPRTGRRVAKLFLPRGGWHFWSRDAYGLGFASQRETLYDRLRRKARRLHRALGSGPDDDWQMPPDKPKWMRWQTYERKYTEWEAAMAEVDAMADAALCKSVARLLRLSERRRS